MAAENTGKSIPKASPKSEGGNSLHRVYVGSFDDEDSAKRQANELVSRGYTTRVVSGTSGGKKVYRVLVGAYRDRDNADRIAAELRANGYSPTVDE